MHVLEDDIQCSTGKRNVFNPHDHMTIAHDVDLSSVARHLNASTEVAIFTAPIDKRSSITNQVQLI
jgi:hypothetical protein